LKLTKIFRKCCKTIVRIFDVWNRRITLNGENVIKLCCWAFQGGALCVPQMYVYVVSYCFGDTFVVSLVVSASTERFFPFVPILHFLIHPFPFPGFPVPFPCALWFCGPSIIYLFSFKSLSVYFLLFNHISYKLFIILVISLSMLCFCLVSAWAPCHWFLLPGRVGVAFIEHAFPWWSCLSYFLSFYFNLVPRNSSGYDGYRCAMGEIISVNSHIPTLAQCASICFVNNDCQSYFHQPNTRECSLCRKAYGINGDDAELEEWIGSLYESRYRKLLSFFKLWWLTCT
jgi:hypothetical protein